MDDTQCKHDLKAQPNTPPGPAHSSTYTTSPALMIPLPFGKSSHPKQASPGLAGSPSCPELRQHPPCMGPPCTSLLSTNQRLEAKTNRISVYWRTAVDISFSGRTRRRVHFETEETGVPLLGESLFGDIASSLITSSVNGKPTPRNVIFS